MRGAAVLLQKGKILLVEHEKGRERYWVLPGGRVKEGEEVRETVARELKEELGLDVQARKLLFVDEVICSATGRHDLELTFQAEVLGGELVVETGTAVKRACFFPLEDLGNIDLRPPLGRALLEVLTKKGGGGRAQYLGNMWKGKDEPGGR